MAWGMLWAAAGVLGLVAGAGAQQTMHAPDGGTREHIDSISVSEKPGAPFRATVVTSWKRRLEDGTETTVYNRRTIARDSTGRVFQERRFFSPTGNTQPTQVSQVEYYDPARNEMTYCEMKLRRCTAQPWRMNTGDAVEQPVAVSTNGFEVKREALGDKTLENLQVVGSREIITSPRLGASEPTVKEFWYSPRLGINLVVRRFEPHGGAQDFAVESIDLNEPDPQLFQLPANFPVFRAQQQ